MFFDEKIDPENGNPKQGERHIFAQGKFEKPKNRKRGCGKNQKNVDKLFLDEISGQEIERSEENKKQNRIGDY